MLDYFVLIALIIFGNLIYAYQCIFQTRLSTRRNMALVKASAIMTRFCWNFCCPGFAVTLAIALLTSIEGAWLLFVYGFVQACIGAVVCFQTIHSYWGSVNGVKILLRVHRSCYNRILNLMVLITGWDPILFKR